LKGATDIDHKYRLVGRGEAGQVALGMGSTIVGIFLSDLAKEVFVRHPNAEISTLGQ
jgi:hypothetical protein